ncbi:HEPN domain-containing protein [Rhodococcus erythropolis]|nr:HEPN domain-containing protein [Rhodococcus erythropolis]
MGDLSETSASGLTALNRSYHKVILIAAASNLESQVKRIVVDFFERHGRAELCAFIDKQVLARNYHTLFDWKQEKATAFFVSFGEGSSKRFKEMLRNDDEFRDEHNAFMKLGSLRNQLVHQDYASFSLDQTPDELINLYRLAIRFPDRFEALVLDPELAREGEGSLLT